MPECFLKSLATSQTLRKSPSAPASANLERLRKSYGPGRWRKLKGFALVRLEDGSECDAEFIGMRRMYRQKRNENEGTAGLKAMNTENAQAQFVVCINNEGYPASLDLRKIYRVLPDERAEEHSLIRVVDESGEDYLYPAKFFVPIQLPQAAEDAFQNAA